MRTAESSVEEAQATNHALTLCYALSQAACAIALLIGNVAAAEHYVTMLLDHSARHALTRWHAFGLCHQGVLAIKRGDVMTGLRLLRAGLDERGEARFAVLRFVAVLMAEAFGRAGRVSEGLAVVEEAIDRSEERWLVAGLLRSKGELLLLEDPPGAAATAEDCFRRALDWARRQGALSWELRAAMSLARLLRDQSRAADALALLQRIYDRFTEGFDTADLKAAKALLNALPNPAAARP
jgi:predicted ATPase